MRHAPDPVPGYAASRYIGIGDNHSAYITLIDDAYEALLTLTKENE